MRTARAKGERGAGNGRHVMRNSLIPSPRCSGCPSLEILAGALITESVFNYPGMGLLFVQSAQRQDYPVMLGVGLVVALAAVGGSLLADIGYAVLDPRVGYVTRPRAPRGAPELKASPGLLPAAKPRSMFRRGLEVFVENRLAVVGFVIIVAIFVFCSLGPQFYHTDQMHVDLANENLPPGPGHPLGTDQNGYDVLGRLMVGGQTSLEVGLAAAVLATVSARCGARSRDTSAGSSTR